MTWPKAYFGHERSGLERYVVVEETLATGAAHWIADRQSGPALLRFGLGREGGGWKQVMGELAFERSGPKRFLSSFTLLAERVLGGAELPDRAALAVGRLSAHLITLRHMSRSVAGALQAGRDPALEAVMVKDLGAVLEQEIPEIARGLADPSSAADADYQAVLAYTVLHAPSFSLRSGAWESLRGIIARGLGLR